MTESFAEIRDFDAIAGRWRAWEWLSRVRAELNSPSEPPDPLKAAAQRVIDSMRSEDSVAAEDALAELERVLAGHPDVALVAVGSIPDEEKGELAKAYIVPKVNTTPSAEEIIRFSREHLAAYKVPRVVQFVSDLPRTSTGKVMRRELRTLDD